jgi:hypothetical protein
MKQLLDKCSKLFIFLTFTSILLLQNVMAQKIEISSDPQNVHLDQDFIITITVPFQKKIKIGNFPEINDFSKKESRFDHQDSLITIVQHYRPRKTGRFQLDPFSVYINDEYLTYDQTTHINVTKTSGSTPKENPLKETDNKNFETEPIQSRLYITSNKTEVYKNEAFEIKLYLEISSENDLEFNFIDLQQQLNVITKKIIPENGLYQFQNFGIISTDTTSPDKTKTFLLTNMLIAAGTTETMIIPSLSFNFLTYDKRRSKGLIERRDNIIKLSSAPYKIQIKDLPEEYSHLSPGNFILQETTSRNHITVNQSFSYQFIVISTSQNLFYSNPNIIPHRSAIVIPETKSKNSLVNDKNQYFSYQIVPTQTGSLKLKDLFYWPYFNTRTNSPDTLKPSKIVQVYGKSNQNSLSYRDSPFYKEIDSEDAVLRPIRKDNMLNLFTNLVILFMFAVTAILIIRK